jgi:hypothetical protein
MGLASRRLWRMRKLLNALTDGDNQKIEERRKEYDAVVSEWNEKFQSMMVRLTLYASWDLGQQLEGGLNRSFVDNGSRLQRLIRTRFATGTLDSQLLADLRRGLNMLSRQVFVFNRDTLRTVQRQRARTYYGVEVEFTRSNLDRFRTWELLKALFKPGVPPFRVVRSAADLRPPFLSRS